MSTKIYLALLLSLLCVPAFAAEPCAELPLLSVRDYRWRFDGTDGLILQYKVPAEEHDTTPNNAGQYCLVLTFILDDPLAESWRVEKAKAYYDAASKEPAADKEQPAMSGGFPSRFTQAYSVYSPADSYFIDAYLHRRKGSAMTVDEAKELLEGDKGCVRMLIEEALPWEE